MPPRRWRLYVQDMLDAISIIHQTIHGKSVEEFLANHLIWGTVLYHLMVLGEAASRIPHEVQARAAIPWGDIRAARNRVVHAYFGTDLELVWGIVTTELEPLIPQLQLLLESDPPVEEG